MSRDFDNFPTYDPVTKEQILYLSNIWADALDTFIQTIQGYLSQNGIFIPNLTTAERDAIQSPVEGQMIYNTNATVGPPRSAALQIWQVKADVGAWRTVTTVP
jgi:hypothetical protein